MGRDGAGSQARAMATSAPVRRFTDGDIPTRGIAHLLSAEVPQTFVACIAPTQAHAGLMPRPRCEEP